MQRTSRFIPALFSVIALGACSTMDGLSRDFESGWNSLSATVAQTFDSEKTAGNGMTAYDGTCPPVSLRPDLAHMTEFMTPDKTDEATKISEATITGVQNNCRVENGQLVMQISITLEGATGPKARVKPSDKPSFAYPYFVAVTDQRSGVVIAKEIFAASLSYEANENKAQTAETISQSMPVPDLAKNESYNVVVGFQLSPEQLAYNHRTMPEQDGGGAASAIR
ncbi:MAG: hypothetical protein WC989_00800 [Micavibrio sp.]